jgi:hypothetical protein
MRGADSYTEAMITMARGWMTSCRTELVTPRVALNDGRTGGSAIDARTTR